MTVSVVPTWVQTPGNGAATVFNFPFLITSTTDLVVTFITGPTGAPVYTTQTSNFSVTFAPGVQGGQVTFSAPPPLGTTVDIRSQIPQSQPTNFANLGAYYPENTTNQADRNARLNSDMYRVAYQFGIHGPDVEGMPWPALPPPSQRLGMGLVFDTVTGLPGVGVLTPTPLTQSGFNGLLGGSNVGFLFYKITQAEINAGASTSIVNPFVKPGNPLRYTINAIPGTTQMGTAFNFAMASLLGTPASPGPGGEMLIDMAGGPYNLEQPVNCTWSINGGAPAVSVRWLGPTHNAHLASSPPVAGCVLTHSSIGFDCTGNDTIQFIDPTITTQVLPAPTVFPQIGILLARNTTKGSLINRIIRPKIVGFFSIANIYNYGSEGVPIDSAYLANFGGAGAGNCLLAFTSNNYAGVQSIVPNLIAGSLGQTPTVSMTVCGDLRGQHVMTAPNPTSDCIHIEGASSIRFRDGFASCPGGRSMLYVDNSFAAAYGASCNWVTIDGFNIDAAGAPKYMIFSDVSGASVAHVGWNLRGLRSNTMAGGYAIGFADTNSRPYNWVVDNISEQQSNGINVPGNIDGFSQFRLGATILKAGGVTVGSAIYGDPANITVAGVVGGVGLGNLNSNTASQINGFGAPTGAQVIQNFPGNTATLQQCSQTIAIILTALLNSGTFGK